MRYLHASQGKEPVEFEELHFVARCPDTEEERDALLSKFASEFLVSSMLAHTLALAALAPYTVACGFVSLGRDSLAHRYLLKSPVLSGTSACNFDTQCVGRTCALYRQSYS